MEVTGLILPNGSSVKTTERVKVSGLNLPDVAKVATTDRAHRTPFEAQLAISDEVSFATLLSDLEPRLKAGMTDDEFHHMFPGDWPPSTTFLKQLIVRQLRPFEQQFAIRYYNWHLPGEQPLTPLRQIDEERSIYGAGTKILDTIMNRLDMAMRFTSRS